MTHGPARHLSDAAEAVRAFNHTSRPEGQDWQYPGHAYDALGNLSHLVGMLVQAIGQATSPVMNTYLNDRIVLDGGGDPVAAVAELVNARVEAEHLAGELAHAVQRMHNATSAMALDTTGMPEFDNEYEGEAP